MVIFSRVLLIGVLALLCGREVSADTHVETDARSSAKQQQFAALVQARLTAISTAFPRLIELTNVGIHVVFREPDRNENVPFATYDPRLDTLTFQRSVLSYANDDVVAAASDYWQYYEREEIHSEYPIVEVIDDVLWRAMLEEFAEQNDLTWPPTGCKSIELPSRLGCQMLIAGVDFFVHSRRARIFNENRLDRLWPADLSQLEATGWQRGDREYREVKELGGIELLKPLVQEFGVPRVFAYIAQTPFVVQENDLFKSATLYQRRAREVLGW